MEKMKAAIFVISLFSLLAVTFAGGKVVCYYSSQAIYYGGDGVVQPEDVNPFLCTHINYAFASVKATGVLSPMDGHADIDKEGFKRIVFLKALNSDLKVLLSVGGPDVPADRFSKIAGDANLTATFVDSAREYMENYDFDGVDFHWTFPEKQDKDNFITLLRAVREDFDKDGWEVSAAVDRSVTDGYDVPKLTEIVDHISLMTYDMYTPTDSSYTGNNAPMHPSVVETLSEKFNLNVDYDVLQWLEAGADARKVLLGIPFYGHTYTLENEYDKYIHSAFTGPGKAGPILNVEGTLSYLEICEHMSADRYYWYCDWDYEQDVPYCTNNYGQWLSYDSVNSINSKMAYLNQKKLGGAMIWSIDQDDVHGRCDESFPLLRTIANYNYIEP